MNKLLLLLVTLLPPIIGCIAFYLFDKKREPIRLIIRLTLYGFLCIITVITITNFLLMLFPHLDIDIYHINNYSIIEIIIYTTIVIALLEEGNKWLFTYLIGTKNRSNDEYYDNVVYAVFVSLGFAVIENVSYVLENGISVALVRCITAVPAHLIFALFMGYFMGLAKEKKRIKYYIMSFIVPIILHSIYDFIAIYYSNVIVLFIFLIIFLITGIILIVKLRKVSSARIIYPKYCLRCGLEVNDTICACGNEKILEYGVYDK